MPLDSDEEKRVVIIYDGDCPFCNSYITYSGLRTHFSTVELIDARSRPELVASYRQQGYDLNTGMIVVAEGQILHGSAAMAWIAQSTKETSRVNGVLHSVFKRTRAGHMTYAVMRYGRTVALRLLFRRRL